jgi:hypothetical protein
MPLPVGRPKAGSFVKREESSRLVVEVHMLSVAMDMVSQNDQTHPFIYWANYYILRVSGPVRSLLSINLLSLSLSSRALPLPLRVVVCFTVSVLGCG